ncbi:MAG: ParA family protein [archaeon]
MTIKLSILNMKGGVGKSTLTVNLAWYFSAISKWKKKILVVDLDPQFNASQYLVGVKEYEKILANNSPTTWDIFEQYTQTPRSPKPVEIDDKQLIYNVTNFSGGNRIDLIPSRLELAFSIRNPNTKDNLLSRTLSKFEDDYDLIIMDCPPTESFLTTAAYIASDFILVPVKPEYLSSIGLPLLVNSLREFKLHHPQKEVKLAGVIFNSTSNNSTEEFKVKSEVKDIAKKNNWYVFNNEITYSRSYPRGAREGQPIFRTTYSQYQPINKLSKVADELAERINLCPQTKN